MNNSESNQNDIINKLDTMLVKYQILEKKIEYISNNINKIQAQMNNFFDYFNDIVNITTNQIKR